MVLKSDHAAPRYTLHTYSQRSANGISQMLAGFSQLTSTRCPQSDQDLKSENKNASQIYWLISMSWVRLECGAPDHRSPLAAVIRDPPLTPECP